ncbi:recombinase family protein [Neobacillus niacini]|uniref:recombinase family protein n=1 Tax=Neobacillus niacini TaxID=86668 RepID=UPI00069370D2|nr:recombinase family protein [Neobacillus niacini]
MVIKDVALLLRISQEKGEGEDTLQNHRDRLVRLCNERGYNWTAYEEIVSGEADLSHRNELNRLIQDLSQYDAVLVISPDRIARKQSVAHSFIETLEKAGIPLVTPERIYSERDLLLLSIEFAMAHQEYKAITKRMMENKLDRVRRGEWIQGRCPLGFTRGDDKKLVIDESESQIIRSIFDLAEQGYGLPTIAERLPYKTAKGQPFTVPTVHNILHNPAYIGTISYSVKKGRNPESIVTKNAHPAIISREQWNNVQLALQSRMQGDNETRTRSRGMCHSILKDLTYCMDCGKKLSYRPDSKLKHLVYLRECKCGMNGVNQDKVIVAFLHEFTWLEEVFRRDWKKALEGVSSNDKQRLEQSIKELQKKAGRLNRRFKNIKLQRADGELTKLEAEEMKQETEKEQKLVNAQLEDLQEQLQTRDEVSISRRYHSKIDLISSFYSAMSQPHADKEECNRILKLLIHKVHYKRESKGYIEYHEQMRMDDDEFITDIKVKIDIK